MKQFFTLLAAVLLTATTFAQVSINTETPDASAALDIFSTTGGLLVPRMKAAQRDGITATQGLIIFCTDCAFGEGELQVKLTSSWKNTIGGDVNDPVNDPSPFAIGDTHQGGVVFWLDSTGQHGLVVAFSDVATSVVWGCYSQYLPNVQNVQTYPPVGQGAEIGHGFNNTNNILKDCPTAPAALAARSLGAQWFLPSAKELNQMYINKTTLEGVSGFSPFSGYYWSSTEYDDDIAWFEDFLGQGTVSKNFTANVRAVRAF